MWRGRDRRARAGSDPAPQPGRVAWDEGSPGQAPDPGVVRRVHPQHGPRYVVGVDSWPEGIDALLVPMAPQRIGKNRGTLLVARRHEDVRPEGIQCGVVADGVVPRVGIRSVRGVERVEGDGWHGGHSHAPRSVRISQHPRATRRRRCLRPVSAGLTSPEQKRWLLFSVPALFSVYGRIPGVRVGPLRTCLRTPSDDR